MAEGQAVQPACVNCGQAQANHHRDGWCFWLSDTDHFPLQYSATAQTIVVLVDDQGRPLGAPREQGNG